MGMSGFFQSPFPGEQVDYHLKMFGHLPERECGDDVRLCSQEKITVIEGEHSTIYTNGPTGGWVRQKDGAIISIDAAKEMNRAQRRKLGIKL